MASQERINGFVLAGGKSSRMGQDKALMRFGDTHLVARAAELLTPFVTTVTILGPPDRYRSLNLPVIADLWPDEGPLAAVCTGLLTSDTDWNIFLACDLPLVSAKFIELLIHRAWSTRLDAVVPRTEDGWQPLSAAYRARCRETFMRGLHSDRRSIIGRLSEIPVDVITLDEMVRAGLSDEEFVNVNTPEEWARLERQIEKGLERHAERR